MADTERNRKAAEGFAESQRREILAQLEIGQSPATIDFATAAGLFLAFARDVKYRRKAASYRRIKTSFSSLIEYFGPMAVGAIDAGAIDLYKQWRIVDHRVKDVTVRHDLHALSLFFQHGIKQHWCSENRVREVEIPSDIEAVRTNVLSFEQEQRYFAVAKGFVDKLKRPNLYDIGRLMINQGFRPEEVMHAPKDCVDLKQKTFEVNKGKTKAAKRTIYLNDESCRILAERMKLPGIWLFPSQRYPDRPLTKVNKTHDLACEKAGVAFVLYDLRHTFGTRMAALGVDPFTLASIMGHANLRTIQRYVHPQTAEKKAAMAKYEAAMKRGGLKVVNR